MTFRQELRFHIYHNIIALGKMSLNAWLTTLCKCTSYATHAISSYTPCVCDCFSTISTPISFVSILQFQQTLQKSLCLSTICLRYKYLWVDFLMSFLLSCFCISINIYEKNKMVTISFKEQSCCSHSLLAGMCQCHDHKTTLQGAHSHMHDRKQLQ